MLEAKDGSEHDLRALGTFGLKSLEVMAPARAKGYQDYVIKNAEKFGIKSWKIHDAEKDKPVILELVYSNGAIMKVAFLPTTIEQVLISPQIQQGKHYTMRRNDSGWVSNLISGVYFGDAITQQFMGGPTRLNLEYDSFYKNAAHAIRDWPYPDDDRSVKLPAWVAP